MAKVLDLYKWYYHSKKKNETLKSIQASVDHMMLVFVGNPGCSICAAQWKALNTPKFTQYLKDNEIVGLKVDDSTSHYLSLLSQAKRYRNPDGSKTTDGPPFLALVKNNAVMTDLDLSMTFKKTGVPNILEWICGSTSKYVPVVNDKNVIAWIEEMKKTDIYKKAFPWLVPPRVLKTTPLAEAIEAENLKNVCVPTKIKSSEDVKIKYSELCDCDEIYIITVCGSEFLVSYRYCEGMPEPQIWMFGDDEDRLICTTKKLSKIKKQDTIKSAFIAYMLGIGKLEIV